jgi:hypothetical protein
MMRSLVPALILTLCGVACRDKATPSPTPPPASATAAPSASAAAATGSAPARADAAADDAGEPADADVDGRPAPVGGNWLSCYSGFTPRTDPKLDVMRLGLMCGPSNGMHKHASDQSEVKAGAAGREHRFEVAAGECFRVFAVAEPRVKDIDVQILDDKGRRIAFDTSDDRWPVVKPDGPFCAVEAGALRAVVRAQNGSGRYAIEVWRLRAP